MRILGGKYKLIRQIASGGMGTVWLSEHTQLGTSLAVKMMAPQSLATPVLRTRFEREARSAAQLKGANVVTVHDFGVDEGTPYIAMELLEGEDLGARLRKSPVMAPPLAAAIVDGVSRALERAHELGIVHRDIKASNVFLAREGDAELVKVLDFGVAKSGFADVDDVGDITSTTDAMIGSPSSMSPEQIRSAKNVDHRTDLWAVGVLAYRMVTGQLPFQGEGRGDLMVRICTEPFPPVRDLLPTLPPTLDAFFARALAKDPAGRFQSARELSIAFSTALGLPPPSQTGALPPMGIGARRDVPAGPPSGTGPGSYSGTGPHPVDRFGPSGEPGTLGAGSLATSSVARSRQASLASLVVVFAALSLGLVAAFFVWKANGDPDGARAPAAPGPSTATARVTAAPAPVIEPETVPEPTPPPAASSAGTLVDLSSLAPAPSASPSPSGTGVPSASAPRAAPRPSARPATSSNRLDLGL